MKISKKALLAISGLLNISALGLMFASASDRDLFMDIHNAVQHINEVKVISTGNDTSTATLSNTGGLVRIDTNNFILGETGDKKNIITDDMNGSSILGGENNRIGGGYNVILGGSGNKVGGSSNTILGGEGNNVNARTCGSYNTIIGGKNNIISGGTSTTNNCISITDQSESSVIIGGHDNNLHGRFSVVMGNNSSVKGNNSVALGSGSHIQADNSFLWTDRNSHKILETNDVFVIMAQNGAVINRDKAHSFAKLTLGGPLVLSDSDNQSNIQCGQGQGGGIIKMEKSENNQLCLCSCDGSGWNSMFSNGACSKVCNKFIEPPKCGTEVNTDCTRRGVVYSGSCKNGTVIEGTGAYFVDKNDIVHRSCQTSDGQVDSSCTGTVSWTADEKLTCLKRISTCIGGATHDKDGNPCNSTLSCGSNEIEENGECIRLGVCLNEMDQPNPNNNKELIGFNGDYSYNRYLPKSGTGKWTCVNNISDENAHSCTFSCGEGYECGYRGAGGRVLDHNTYASCIPTKNKCGGDYSIFDASMDIYNTRTYDNVRVGNVFKKPNSSNTAWQYFSNKSDVPTDQYGCYAVCPLGYHEPHPDDPTTYRNRGTCIRDCGDSRISNGHGMSAQGSKTHGYMRVTNRWPWKYKELDIYKEMLNDPDIGQSEEKSCIWTCNNTEATPLIIKGPVGQKHAYVMSGEKAGSTIATEFDEFLNNPKNIKLYDGGVYPICREKCKDTQYFDRMGCTSLGTGFIQDTNNCITFNNITNCYKTIGNCNDNEFRLYELGRCVPKSISLKEKCNMIIESKPRYKRIPSTNECKMCETPGQYVTENGECIRCNNPNSPECTPKST